jgi:hypothetical protein
LDGEKNLKPRAALMETSKYFIDENFSNDKSYFSLEISAKKPD